MTTFFAFAIADSMFPARCKVSREPMTPSEVRIACNKPGANIVSALNPSHAATIDAMKSRYAIRVEIPEIAPRVSLVSGDAVIVMSVRGLPRLDATRHEYTADEIARATFEFACWEVL